VRVDTRRLVDPELATELDTAASLDLSTERLPIVRRALAAEAAVAAATRSDVVVTEHLAPAANGDPDVRVVVTRPAGPSEVELPVLLWIHGGGYVVGDVAGPAPFLDSVVSELGCVTVSVDYRLAPETPHPGPIEDCYAALRWVVENAAGLGVDIGRLVIGGASAGGGLAAALALLARDRREFALCLAVLVEPMLDDRTATETDRNPVTGEFVWTRADNAFGWSSLLGHEPGRPGVSPYAAAARADDLTGLPPTFIAVGALDLFVDEDLAYAHRLLRAGVPTELHVYPGAFHGFLDIEATGVARRHRRDIGDALHSAFR
jgi:acetyl esterase/lipase